MVDTVKVKNTKTGATILFEVLDKGSKHIKLVLPDSDVTITLYRSDLHSPFIGHHMGMELITIE